MGKKVIGIIGGMGPLATADLFQKIILHTAAGCDQEHLRVCIDSNTNIPDRTAALLRGGADPVPEMVKSARRLESIGADVLIMPCNTAHNYYHSIEGAVSVPVLHMIALTRDALRARGVKCAGLLATDGTVQTGIYQRTFAQSGITLLTPDADGQSAVMDVIYNGVKASEMESAALFVVAAALKCRCGSCFHTVWNQEREKAGLDQTMSEDTTASVKAAVEALKRIIAKDTAL